MMSTARKYWTILKIAIVEKMTYRTDFLFGTLMRFLPIISTIFLWRAVVGGSENERVAGFTWGDFVAYYLLTMVGRAFSSMPGLANNMATDIRTGNIKKYLTQPIDMLGYYLMTRVAHKVVYYSIALIPFAIVFFLCRGFMPNVPRLEVWIVFLISLVFAFLIGFLLEACIGLSAFWILEVASITHIVITLNYVLSGHMFPLDLIPNPTARHILMLLPFSYLAYFPATLYLRGDAMSSAEIWGQLMIPLTYTVLLAIAAKLLYSRGLRRYSAFGG